MLAVIARLDHLEYRVASPRQRAEGGEKSAAVVLVHAVIFRYRALPRSAGAHRCAPRAPARPRPAPSRSTVRARTVRTGSPSSRPAHSISSSPTPRYRQAASWIAGCAPMTTRDLELAARRCRAPREQREMMVGRDADHRAAAVEHREARERQVAAAALGIARDDGARGDVRAQLAHEESRHRQRGERILGDDHALHRRGGGRGGRQGRADRGAQPRQDLAHLDAERRGDPLAPVEQIPGDPQRRAHDLVEHERRAPHRRPTGRPIARSTDRPPCRSAATALAARARPGTAVWTAVHSHWISSTSRTHVSCHARILF